MPVKPYFKDQSGPTPIRETIRRRVRFEEADILGIMWHGRYPSYLEDGREDLGRRYGIGYLDFKAAGVALPIRTLHLDHFSPVRYGEEVAVETILHWHEAARINIEYTIRDGEGRLACTGYTIQMMVDFSHQLLLEAPPFYLEFQKRWREGLTT